MTKPEPRPDGLDMALSLGRALRWRSLERCICDDPSCQCDNPAFCWCGRLDDPTRGMDEDDERERADRSR